MELVPVRPSGAAGFARCADPHGAGGSCCLASKQWKSVMKRGQAIGAEPRGKGTECSNLEWTCRVATVWGVWSERRVKILRKVLWKRSAMQYGMKEGGPSKVAGSSSIHCLLGVL